MIFSLPQADVHLLKRRWIKTFGMQFDLPRKGEKVLITGFRLRKNTCMFRVNIHKYYGNVLTAL